MKELLLYCDESTKDGRYYSNFYGGALVSSDNYNEITDYLNEVKQNNNLFSEIKWTKVTESYLDKYIAVIDCFFDFISRNMIKLRIMFSQNAFEATGLTQEQHENRFFLLYYQFIKHAFGFKFCNETGKPIFLKLFFDLLPDNECKSKEFKKYIQRLEFTDEFKQSGLKIRPQDIGEVRSHDHVILQCMDIVLGSMQFRLNNMHRKKLPNSNYRGKKTKAKENLYKHILRRIQGIYPYFNIGINTGIQGDIKNCWMHPYRHWKFTPRSSNFNDSLTKKKRCPVEPT